MKLEVEWAGPKHPRQAKIKNVEIDSDEGVFEERYVSFSGYFGNYGPDVFAAAPELLEALEQAIDWIKFHQDNPGTINHNAFLFEAKAERIIKKARGEK